MVMATNETMNGHGTNSDSSFTHGISFPGGAHTDLLVLLLCVKTLDGSPLPEKFLTIPNCHNLSIECGEEEPYKVGLLSPYEACLTYKENEIITDLAIKLMAVET